MRDTQKERKTHEAVEPMRTGFFVIHENFPVMGLEVFFYVLFPENPHISLRNYVMHSYNFLLPIIISGKTKETLQNTLGKRPEKMPQILMSHH